jgi:hypothetical protein
VNIQKEWKGTKQSIFEQYSWIGLRFVHDVRPKHDQRFWLLEKLRHRCKGKTSVFTNFGYNFLFDEFKTRQVQIFGFAEKVCCHLINEPASNIANIMMFFVFVITINHLNYQIELCSKALVFH